MTTKQTHTFQTEVSQLLDLMIHSLYSNKEIFLRELVSNASDAVDKLKFKSLSDDTLIEGKEELQIHIDVNKDVFLNEISRFNATIIPNIIEKNNIIIEIKKNNLIGR